MVTGVLERILYGEASPRYENALWIGVCCLCGAASGFLAGWWIPKAVGTARLIGVLPAAWLSLVFVRECTRVGFAYTFAEAFDPVPDGEAQWVLFLFTGPTLCAIFYSAGVVIAAKRRTAIAAHSGT